MITPGWVRPGDEVTTLGHFYDSPIVGKGWSWLPINELIAWVGFGWWLQGRNDLTLWAAALWGFVAMVIFLGSEWCHNLAHAYAAHRIGKPVNAIRVLFGLPLLAYFSEDDQHVLPKEHIIRAAGGPILNTIFAIPAALWYFLAVPGTVNHDLALVFLSMNVFIVIAGLSPMPVLDGGVILKWWLVLRGQTEERADWVVRVANGISGGIMLKVTVGFIIERTWGWASLAGMFTILFFLLTFDLIKQDN